MKRINNTQVYIVIALLMMASFSNCKKIEIVESTTSDVNIYDYLKARPDKYSSLVQVIEKSGNAGFLNAYGSYTLFAPTNEAFALYLKEINKQIDQITEAEAKNIVKFHLLEDTLTTSSFKDGKLPLVTMYGQYLVTSYAATGGSSGFTINRQAVVTQTNIKTGNGFIHAIDHVLKPAVKSLAQLISENPDFSIFNQALIATGYNDTLGVINTTNPDRRWLTLLAETNQALRDSGITSYSALAAKYSNTGNPKNPSDSLHIYMAYHIIPEAKYLADIISATSHFTLQPLEILASGQDSTLKILINDIDFNGVHEKGTELQLSTSDVAATNGVLHTSLAHFAPKKRTPFAVYWDVADFPEIRKLPAVFRKSNFSFAYGSIKDITWDKSTNTLDYVFSTASNAPHVYNDYLSIPMGNTSRHFWIDFKTPLLVKGKYKVWICYRAGKGSGTLGQPGGSNMPVQTYFDGIPTSRPFAFTDQRPNVSDGEMEALGWKRYTLSTQQNMSGKFLGIVDVATTDRHIFRLQSLPAAGTGNTTDFLDMVHFIPIDAPSQYLPRFDRDGSKVTF